MANDSDEGENARVSYSLSHGNDDALFDVDEQTGVLTTTRTLPATPANYRLVITADDHGDPAHVTVLDLSVIVNDTATVRHGRRDDRLLAVFGAVCGLTFVSILALVVCLLIVLRRVTVKPASRSTCTTDLPESRAVNETVSDMHCGTSAARHHQHCNDHYTTMINVRHSILSCRAVCIM